MSQILEMYTELFRIYSSYVDNWLEITLKIDVIVMTKCQCLLNMKGKETRYLWLYSFKILSI